MAETELKWYPAKVLDTINEGVAVILADGRYAFTNEAAQRFLGTEETVIVKRPGFRVGAITWARAIRVPCEWQAGCGGAKLAEAARTGRLDTRHMTCDSAVLAGFADTGWNPQVRFRIPLGAP